MDMQPFRPTGNGVAGTVSIDATAASSRVAILQGHNQYEIYNSGSVRVAVCFGDVTIAATLPSGATAGSYIVGPGQTKIVSPNLNSGGGAYPTHVAAIAASGTQTVFITAGAGL